MRFLVLTLVLIGAMLALADAAEHHRAKRGIASFFKRIWPIRKNKNNQVDMMETSASMPQMSAVQYPYTDYASYQQMFNQQLYQNPEIASQLQAAQQQLNAQYNAQYGNQDSYQQQMSQQMSQNQASQSGPYQPQAESQYQGQDMMQQSQQSQLQSQSTPDAQDNVAPDQSQGSYMEESAPHPSVYARPQGGYQDPNQFHGRPYGNSPGTIDVHQVLDQFIRQAGLSPQGDHDNAVSASEAKPVFSMKKLYSYPFYLSTSGNKPTSHSGFGRR